MEAGPMSTVLSCRMSRRALLAGAAGVALTHAVRAAPVGPPAST